MLSIEQIRVVRQQRTILQTDNISVSSSQMLAILGPNGAGKSSLLKAISGEWPYQSGHISFHNRILSDWNRRQLACHLGILPQSSKIEFPLTAQEVVAIGATPLSLNRRHLPAQVKRFLMQVDACHLADQSYTQLSGGERQRVQLARVLLQISQAEKPPLLLLDEPTSAQDLGHQHQLMTLLKQLACDQEFSIIAVLHDLNIASHYCQNVAVINQGKVRLMGAAQKVLTPEQVKRHWQYLPERINRRDNGFALL